MGTALPRRRNATAAAGSTPAPRCGPPAATRAQRAGGRGSVRGAALAARPQGLAGLIASHQRREARPLLRCLLEPRLHGRFGPALPTEERDSGGPGATVRQKPGAERGARPAAQRLPRGGGRGVPRGPFGPGRAPLGPPAGAGGGH